MIRLPQSVLCVDFRFLLQTLRMFLTASWNLLYNCEKLSKTNFLNSTLTVLLCYGKTEVSYVLHWSLIVFSVTAGQQH